MSAPSKCAALIDALVDNGWSFAVNRHEDTAGNPFLNVEAKRGDDHVIATWHTRGTGTYRLFSCLLNKRDVTLTKAMRTVRS